MRKFCDDGKGGEERGERGGRDGQIVGESEALSRVDRGEALEQDIEADSKKKGGGWAALLDPSPNVNTVVCFRGENRLDLNVVKKAPDCVTDPEGHVDLLENSMDKGVRN